jgi:hypothetical protein
MADEPSPSAEPDAAEDTAVRGDHPGGAARGTGAAGAGTTSAGPSEGVDQGATGVDPGATGVNQGATGNRPVGETPLNAQATEKDAFAERPEAFVGAAFAGGLALAMIMRRLAR